MTYSRHLRLHSNKIGIWFKMIAQVIKNMHGLWAGNDSLASLKNKPEKVIGRMGKVVVKYNRYWLYVLC